MNAASASSAPLNDTLHLRPEYRLTKQRREVFEVLKAQRDHPTATEVFVRVKDRVPGISLATVYNCLETLTENGLVKQVHLDRGPARYCPNLHEHGHFHCERCGEVTDVRLREAPQSVLALPRGSRVNRMEISLRGICPRCAKEGRSAGTESAKKQQGEQKMK